MSGNITNRNRNEKMMDDDIIIVSDDKVLSEDDVSLRIVKIGNRICRDVSLTSKKVANQNNNERGKSKCLSVKVNKGDSSTIVKTDNKESGYSIHVNKKLQSRPKRFISTFFRNFIDVTPMLTNEFNVMKWFNSKYLPTEDTDVQEYLKQKQNTEKLLHLCMGTRKWFASHTDLLPPALNTMLKLSAIVPTCGENTVDLILEVRAPTYKHIRLEGIKKKFFLEVKKFQRNYLIHPHLDSINDIAGQFHALALAKYDNANRTRMFIVCRIGRVYIFVALKSWNKVIYYG